LSSSSVPTDHAPLIAEVETFIFLNVRGSPHVYWIMSQAHFEIFQSRRSYAPDAVYWDTEFREYSCPFTYTTMVENLPFALSPMGRFRLRTEKLPRRDQHLFEFQMECLAITKKHELSPRSLWFDHIAEGHQSASEFLAAYRKLVGNCKY